MKIIKVHDYAEVSLNAGEMILEKVKQQSKLVLGLATGGTPIGTYQCQCLIEDFKRNQTSYKHVHTINLDEYVGLNVEDRHSYAYYMRTRLFNHLDLPHEQTHIPNGVASDLVKECHRYESVITSLGGVDLQLLGIGENGHIGFNEPGTSFLSKTSVVELSPLTRKANARYFNSLDEVPSHAISMGISTIMQCRQIILLASGEKKAKILQQLLSGQVSEQVPASILKKHHDVTIIADQAALENYHGDYLVGF